MAARLMIVAILACAACDGVRDECSVPGTICTVIGNGSSDPTGTFDPTPALSATLAQPIDVVVDPETGIVYVIDFNHLVIRALGRDAILRTIAGNGEIGAAEEGPAVASGINHTADMLLDGAGGLYLAAFHNSRVLRVDLQTGLLARVAGLGTRSAYTGDGGPALDAALDLPSSLALLPDGRLLVTDQENQVIRQIDRQTGVIDHFAGRCIVDMGSPCAAPVQCPGSQKLACNPLQCSYPCSPGFAGDAATVDDLRLALPYGATASPGGKIVVGADATIYIADCDNQRIRTLATDGRVATVAGGGKSDSDGGPATAARLEHPTDVAVAADGTLYVADFMASCIRRIDVDGTIHTAAGVCGTPGFAGDRGPARTALLDHPMGIFLDAIGNRLYIADTLNNRVRALTFAP